MSESCRNCRAWRGDRDPSNTDVQGKCFRRAPSPIYARYAPEAALGDDEDPDNYEWVTWPPTWPDSWCGEWLGMRQTMRRAEGGQ